MPFYLIQRYKLALKLKEKPLTRKCCENPRSILRVVKGGSDHVSREEKQPFHISQVKN